MSLPKHRGQEPVGGGGARREGQGPTTPPWTLPADTTTPSRPDILVHLHLHALHEQVEAPNAAAMAAPATTSAQPKMA